MKMFKRSLLVSIAAFAVLPNRGSVARAQDNAPSGEPVVASIDPVALAYDYLVDGRLAQDDLINKKFKTLQAAYAAVPAGTAEKPTVIGIAPNVYQLPPAAGSTTSLTINKNYITLLGLTNNRRAVVLADNRGNKMGGDGANGVGSSNAQPARARVGAGAGAGHRADPRDETDQIPRGESRCRERGPHRRRAARNRRGAA